MCSIFPWCLVLDVLDLALNRASWNGHNISRWSNNVKGHSDDVLKLLLGLYSPWSYSKVGPVPGLSIPSERAPSKLSENRWSWTNRTRSYTADYSNWRGHVRVLSVFSPPIRPRLATTRLISPMPMSSFKYPPTVAHGDRRHRGWAESSEQKRVCELSVMWQTSLQATAWLIQTKVVASQIVIPENISLILILEIWPIPNLWS